MRRIWILMVLVPFVLFAQEPCEDTVFALSHADTVFVHHYGAYYNCCAVIDYDVTLHNDTIDIVEYETFPNGACYCMCCFNLILPISNLLPGKYLVRVWSSDHMTLYGEDWVVVGFTKTIVALPPWQSPCLSEVCGDSNGDREITADDFIYLGNYLFAGGPPPLALHDPNNDSRWDASDFIFLGNYLYFNGPAPCSEK